MDSVQTSWKQYFSVQPPLVLYVIVHTVIGTVVQDFLVYQSCVDMLGKNYSQCAVLHENSSSHEALAIKIKVQPNVNNIQMLQTMLNNLVPGIIILFLGPWSDIFGRKPLLIVAYFGEFVHLIILAVVSSLHMKAWFVVVSLIPGICTGNFPMIMLSTTCYICDSTYDRNRAWHLALMHAFLNFGFLAGILATPVLFDNFHYPTVFGICAAGTGIAFLYVLFLVEESVQVHQTRTWCGVFDPSLVKRLVVTCFVKRSGFNRGVVWCCIIVLALEMAIFEAYGVIIYYFTSTQFGWDINTFSVYQAVSLAILIVGTPTGIKIVKPLLGCSDSVASMIFAGMNFISMLTTAFAWKSWHMYLAQAVGFFNACMIPILQSVLSKSVPAEDSGKIFSFSIVVQTIFPAALVPIIQFVYSHTLPPMYPAIAFIILATCYVLITGIIMVIHAHQTRYTIM